MKVGIQLPEIEREVRWAELREMVLLIEDLGFDSIWVGDHLLYRAPHIGVAGPWESWSQLAAIAALTERVEFGPLVASTSFHSPAMLAKKAATVEEISGGRLILGLGAGWNETEYRAFGFPFDNRVSRFEEAFTIIRTLLRDGEIDYSGRFYDIRECVIHPRGPRPSGPPLMIGSRGPRMLEITAPHMDAWNAWHAWFGNDPARLRPIIQKLEAALRAAGRDPGEVTKTAAALVQVGDGSGRIAGDPSRGVSTPITGRSQEIAEKLNEFGAIGVEHLQIVIDPISVGSIKKMADVLRDVKSQ
ncbi:MAG: LLM class flavin-dependent oxidoreductase [Acidimicrobiia bacterium]|nr:LLM class flavin-dependent oxidoreductase [Acidimicrobiia bacterium]